MKKVLLGLTTAFLMVIMCFSMAGCAGKVAGKTYVYDSYSIKYDKSDLSDAEKKIIEGVVELAAAAYKNVKYEFVDESVVKVSGIPGTYKQEGSEITVNGADKLTVSGSKLKQTVKSNDGKYKYEVVFKKA